MADEKGHESGQVPHIADAFTWHEYVESLVQETGGWVDLANALLERASEDEQLPEDPKNVEKQLRRLAKKTNRGDRYGQLLLRYFGLPPSIEEWGRLMGQYHSRFADLPVGIRRQQLLRWDRPPVSESPAAMWVHIGLASLAHRDRRLEEVHDRLRLAAEVRKPDKVAFLEYLIFSARLASDEGRLEDERHHLLLADGILEQHPLPREDAACYRARIIDQRAYRLSRDWRINPAGLRDAKDLYASIPATDVPPFVSFRRAHGLAWCAWRMGDRPGATALARSAYDHAGDGGFVRLRIMALKLLADISEDDVEAGILLERAMRLAEMLEDKDLMDRLCRQAGRRIPKTP